MGCFTFAKCVMVVVSLLIFAKDFLSSWALPGLMTYGKEEVFTDLWNSTMISFRCCGFNNYTDFSESYFYEQNGLLYPPTCCRTPAGYPCVEETALFSHVVGCYKKIVSLVQRNIILVSAIAIGIAGIEMAAIAMAIYLYCYLDDKAT
ncbi:tetraspanin-1 isoform X2 [Triplophysa rosa]|uniref:tetraspanin-1 isoform X2 n=1 Tax=Triplophysa rosa TaxID=992332 RepID=UPI002545C565|nr:tetraspanin-1 isoform X2 [Triplophysa rosa]